MQAPRNPEKKKNLFSPGVSGFCFAVRWYFSRFASGAAEICELFNMLWSHVCVRERPSDKLGHKLAVHLNCPAPPSVHSNLFLLWLHCVQSEKSFNSTFYQRTCFVIQVFWISQWIFHLCFMEEPCSAALPNLLSHFQWGDESGMQPTAYSCSFLCKHVD